MLRGQLIVFEAGDGSGKATQTRKLFERLSVEGDRAVHKISFPDYQSSSSTLIRMYLRGEFGRHADDVDAYAASTFYAVDRYASFKTDWKKYYDAGDIIIADRYVTSNMVHQAVKINDPSERQKFLSWLDDFEYEKLKLPRPDLVIFLDMPPSITEKFIAERSKKDIHETDKEYLHRCYQASKELAAQYHWTVLNCAVDNTPRGIDDIAEDVFSVVKGVLNNEEKIIGGNVCGVDAAR